MRYLSKKIAELYVKRNIINPAGQLKYFDRTTYKSQKGNSHVSDSSKAVRIVANNLPIIN